MSQQQWRYNYWFVFANYLFALLFGLSYFTSTSFQAPPDIGSFAIGLSYAFVILSWVGQLGLITLVPGLIIAKALSFLPWPKIQRSCLIILGTLMSAYFVIDTICYHIFHFHMNGVLFNLLFSKDSVIFFGFSQGELYAAAFTLLILLFIQLMFVYGISKINEFKPIKASATRHLLIAGCWLCSILFFLLAGSQQSNDGEILLRNHVITSKGRVFPLYYQTLASLLPKKYSVIALEHQGAGLFWQPHNSDEKLHYPLHPMSCQIHHKLNVLIIGLDAWRFDALTQQLTPNIAKFAQKNIIYQNHFSGGNATAPGLFSLFYSIPSSYWHAMVAHRQSPILMQLFKDAGYQFEILTSAPNNNPPFNKSIFVLDKHLRTHTPGRYPYQHDIRITQDMIKYLHHHKTPFFSFLFYNLTHSYCTYAKIPTIFKPSIAQCHRYGLNNKTNPIPYLNRYHNTVHYVDSLIGKVFAALKQEKLFKNTIIMVTGDHGEEFNDNHQNYWGHASNFSRYQTQTPLILHWPGMDAKTVTTPTMHYDVVPTLLKHLFNCSNPTRDYSIGHDLLSPKAPAFYFFGSYVDYGLRRGNRITVIFPTGNYSIYTKNYKQLLGAKLNNNLLKRAYSLMLRYQ